MEGQIIKIISNQYTVLTADKKSYLCICMGKIRLKIKPKVGDFVVFYPYDDLYGIEEIKPRFNELVRPPIANIDQALVVMSCHEPDFSCTLVDRLIFLCQLANIKPVVCITKMDLAKPDDVIYDYIKDYEASGYQVLLSNKDTLNPDIMLALKHKITVLKGQSGVGKSSLLNLIDPQLKLQTQAISKALNRGKHTTRHLEVYQLEDGLLADTPGFSALEFNTVDPHHLTQVILEFKPYINACYFNDCLHVNEPKCAVKQAVEKGEVSKIRYENYLKVLQLIKGENL